MGEQVRRAAVLPAVMGHPAPRQGAVRGEGEAMTPVGQHMANLRRRGGLGKNPKRAEERAQQLAAFDEDWNGPWPWTGSGTTASSRTWPTPTVSCRPSNRRCCARAMIWAGGWSGRRTRAAGRSCRPSGSGCRHRRPEEGKGAAAVLRHCPGDGDLPGRRLPRLCHRPRADTDRPASVPAPLQYQRPTARTTAFLVVLLRRPHWPPGQTTWLDYPMGRDCEAVFAGVRRAGGLA